MLIKLHWIKGQLCWISLQVGVTVLSVYAFVYVGDALCCCMMYIMYSVSQYPTHRTHIIDNSYNLTARARTCGSVGTFKAVDFGFFPTGESSFYRIFALSTLYTLKVSLSYTHLHT